MITRSSIIDDGIRHDRKCTKGVRALTAHNSQAQHDRTVSLASYIWRILKKNRSWVYSVTWHRQVFYGRESISLTYENAANCVCRISVRSSKWLDSITNRLHDKCASIAVIHMIAKHCLSLIVSVLETQGRHFGAHDHFDSMGSLFFMSLEKLTLENWPRKSASVRVIRCEPKNNSEKFHLDSVNTHRWLSVTGNRVTALKIYSDCTGTTVQQIS